MKEKGKSKSPPDGRAYRRKLRQLVQLQSDAALLAGGIVLMQNSLLDRLVNGLDGSLVSAIGLLTVAFCQGSVKLLQIGFQNGLGSLVLLILHLGQQNSLLCRFNIGHRYTSSNSVTWELSDSLMQKYIIAKVSNKIKYNFLFFKNFGIDGNRQERIGKKGKGERLFEQTN